MTKINRPKILITLAIIAIGASAILLASFAVSQNSKTNSNKAIKQSPTMAPVVDSQLKDYKSSVMKFSIKIPRDFQTEDKLGSVLIKTSNGDIQISQNATNFDNLSDYIFNSKNNLQNLLKNRADLSINGLESITGFIGSEKLYFIYYNNNVYLMSTTSQSLYKVVDQIAQSFRYTP